MLKSLRDDASARPPAGERRAQSAFEEFQPVLPVEHVTVDEVGGRTEDGTGDRLFGIRLELRLDIGLARSGEQRACVMAGTRCNPRERLGIGMIRIVAPMRLEDRVGQIARIEPGCRGGDDHAARQGQIVVVMRRAMGDDGGTAKLRPALDLAPEEIGAMGRREPAETRPPGGTQHWAEVERPVDDAASGRARDFHEPRRAQIRKSRVGGIEVLDVGCHDRAFGPRE